MPWLLESASSWKKQKLSSGREKNLKTIKKLRKLIDDVEDGVIPIAHLRTLFKKIRDLAQTL